MRPCRQHSSFSKPTRRHGRFIDDIDNYMSAPQMRGKLLSAPPRMVAYSVAALVGQLAHRRLTTDDGVTAAEATDFIVSLVIKGLRPD